MHALHQLNASRKRRRLEAGTLAKIEDQPSPAHAQPSTRLALDDGNVCDAGPSSAILDAADRPASGTDVRGKRRAESGGPWACFSADELRRFPALGKRNFFCVQRHQATALHYDLRLQVDGGLVSWAVPKGLLGMGKDTPQHQAVETTVHPISYAVHEGSDGRVHQPSGTRCGTLLWDIGTYRISAYRPDSSDEESDERRRLGRRRRRADDEDGAHDEAKLRDALVRRKVHLTLSGGRKMTGHTYRLVYTFSGYSTAGKEKKTWMLRPGPGDYSWGRGEEEQYGRSVKTGRTFQEVCAGQVVHCSALWRPDAAVDRTG
ncbi:hypothetical protein Q5752_001181 [Cryptotrichosporon argae]